MRETFPTPPQDTPDITKSVGWERITKDIEAAKAATNVLESATVAELAPNPETPVATESPVASVETAKIPKDLAELSTVDMNSGLKDSTMTELAELTGRSYADVLRGGRKAVYEDVYQAKKAKTAEDDSFDFDSKDLKWAEDVAAELPNSIDGFLRLIEQKVAEGDDSGWEDLATAYEAFELSDSTQKGLTEDAVKRTVETAKEHLSIKYRELKANKFIKAGKVDVATVSDIDYRFTTADGRELTRFGELVDEFNAAVAKGDEAGYSRIANTVADFYTTRIEAAEKSGSQDLIDYWTPRLETFEDEYSAKSYQTLLDNKSNYEFAATKTSDEVEARIYRDAEGRQIADTDELYKIVNSKINNADESDWEKLVLALTDAEWVSALHDGFDADEAASRVGSYMEQKFAELQAEKKLRGPASKEVQAILDKKYGIRSEEEKPVADSQGADQEVAAIDDSKEKTDKYAPLTPRKQLKYKRLFGSGVAGKGEKGRLPKTKAFLIGALASSLAVSTGWWARGEHDSRKVFEDVNGELSSDFDSPVRPNGVIKIETPATTEPVTTIGAVATTELVEATEVPETTEAPTETSESVEIPVSSEEIASEPTEEESEDSVIPLPIPATTVRPTTTTTEVAESTTTTTTVPRTTTTTSTTTTTTTVPPTTTSSTSTTTTAPTTTVAPATTTEAPKDTNPDSNLFEVSPARVDEATSVAPEAPVDQPFVVNPADINVATDAQLAAAAQASNPFQVSPAFNPADIQMITDEDDNPASLPVTR